MLKRIESADDSTIEVVTHNELSVDLARHRVTVGAEAVELTSAEFKLLACLISSGGRVLTRDAILDKAWGMDACVVSRTVDTHVRRLRVRLKGAARYIETVRGTGYRFRNDI